MKKMQLIVMAAALLLMAGTAMAAGLPASLAVNATVVGSCTFTANGALSFGLLDPIAAPAVSVSSAGITITCSNGTPYTVTPVSANGGFLKAGLDQFAYTLTLPGGGIGVGTGVVNAPYTIDGDIAAGAYVGKPANVYTDTVTLTVAP